MIKRSLHQKYVINLDLCTDNYRTSKCMQQKLMEPEVEKDKSTISEFGSIFQVIDR